MKKLILKKDVVARINNGEMNQLRGGADTYNICATILHPSCAAANTCAPNLGCGGNTSGDTGGYTGGPGPNNTMTCNTGGGVTQDICGLTNVVSQCDTCYVRCETNEKC